LTQTVTADTSTFDTVLQNEWCNGPEPCAFRDIVAQAGRGAVALGALNTCSTGCGPNFRIARIGLCAQAPGTFTMHWQFSPPDPITRDTQVVDINSNTVSNRTLFTDYTLTINGSALPTITATPTVPTSTPSITRT